ncbi:MAG: LLM class flavin-dependent oxidoreductase [Chloroflexi bacterium]|nr:LLM class flavin-dependent oxidoreductase [Chloroflexota bacterium]
MRFGIFYEHQLPKPWSEGQEQQLFQDALDQVELADKLGIDHAWEVEHHFLEEYSHSSAPEVFLAAASQRTQNIRLGHGIVLMPPGYNHPARVAERIATLDLVSNGRVEFGTGESASRAELEGYMVNPEERRAMWLETVEQVANMLAMNPYPGYEGKYFSMPTRNVVPKPVQKPHPPLWVACSNRDTIHLAAKLGIGALTFAFIDPAEAEHWVNDYYETIKTECVPIGHTVNANIAMVSSFSVHPDADEAERRGGDGFRFFQFALGHHYAAGMHKPGRTNIWKAWEQLRDTWPSQGGEGGIVSPDEVSDPLRIVCPPGVDQSVFIQQAGKNEHEHICESLEIFARDVMPEFKEFEAERVAKKEEELAPYIEEAFKRKAERNEMMAELSDEDIPVYPPYGFDVVTSSNRLSEEYHHEEAEKRAQEQAARFEEMKKTANLAVELGARD